MSKQADVMVLFYLLEDLFSHEVKRASYEYYEKHTLHDSSLSLSTHSVLASDIGEQELGYRMFRKACDIDLGNDDPHSSDAGIHAASCGGLWQCAVYGFGGLRTLGGRLRIAPHLPKAWNSLRYAFNWKGQRLSVFVNQNGVEITNETGKEPVDVTIWEQAYCFTDELQVAKNQVSMLN